MVRTARKLPLPGHIFSCPIEEPADPQQPFPSQRINYKTNKSMNMFKKPFIISAIVTLLACIPLYLLSSQEYSLTTANLPLFALPLFVILLISSFWAAQGSASSGYDYDENELAFA